MPRTCFGMSSIVMQIARDVLAFEAVAARGAEHEAAALVAQRRREPVDLRLGRHRDLLLGRQAEEAADAVDEVAMSSSANALSSDSIGTRWRTFSNLSEGAAPSRCDGLSGANQRRKARLDRGVALPQRVVVGVRDRRGVFLVVGAVVFRDLGGEARELGRGLALAELLDRFGLGALLDRAIGALASSLAAHCGAGVNVNLPSTIGLRSSPSQSS